MMNRSLDSTMRITTTNSLIYLSYSTLFFLFISCSSDNRKVGSHSPVAVGAPAQKKTTMVFATDPEIAMKDFQTWWEYYYQQIHLSEDFIGLDADSNRVSKTHFLTQLATGAFIPIKLMIKDDTAFYKLYAIPGADKTIGSTMKSAAAKLLSDYQQEGTPFPAFDFEDLAGRRYVPGNTRGKVMVIKCWFIHCVACVQEFPELNKLVETYQTREDILFISLAIDTKPALQNFLKERKFTYAVVPGKNDFMGEQLKITEYPTHIIVNEAGRIVKVVSRCDELIPALHKIMTSRSAG